VQKTILSYFYIKRAQKESNKPSISSKMKINIFCSEEKDFAMLIVVEKFGCKFLAYYF